jgi:hypothetical protein
VGDVQRLVGQAVTRRPRRDTRRHQPVNVWALEYHRADTGILTFVVHIDFVNVKTDHPPYFYCGVAKLFVSPNINLYATGGLALVNVNTASTVNFNGTINSLSDSTTHAGWTLGAGLEWMFADRWSAKVEYLYVDLGHATNPLPISNNGLSLNENILRIGINYHFYAW